MVASYKGNVGHLMQHWTLCKLLVLAKQHHTPGLNYIDAHAMAPLAVKNRSEDKPDRRFAKVRDRLPQLPQCRASTYENAWRELKPTKGYPNSAAFVAEIWEGDFSLLLCEIDPETNGELKPWLQDVRKWKRCRDAVLFPDDWRKRFECGLPSPSATGLEDGALTLVSFDTNMCSKRRNVKNHKGKYKKLYQEDLDLAMCAVKGLKGGILIQLSTYSANGCNRQGDVIASVDSIIEGAGFTRCAVVRVHGSMMSLVYERNVSWSDEITRLPADFSAWLPAR